MVTAAARSALVLEDEPQVAAIVEKYLRGDGFEPLLCGTVQDALEALRFSKPAVMILDVVLPDGSGLDVLRAALTSGEHVPAIVLTSRSEESDRIVGLELGADDYMTKPFSPRELIARVHALLRRTGERRNAGDGSVLRVDSLEIDFAAQEVSVECKPARLTATEFRILAVLARSPGEVFTRAALLNALRDAGNIYERTLDRHINNLRKKVERDSRNPSYVVTVYGVGYKMRKP